MDRKTEGKTSTILVVVVIKDMAMIKLQIKWALGCS
jgi:hypothetical protein